MTALALSALAIAAGPRAHAQIAPLLPLEQTLPGLTADDLGQMNAAAAKLYEGRSIGTVERWRNPDSENAGSVTLTASFVSDGMPCRAIVYNIRFKQSGGRLDHYKVNWCRTGDGRWKVVERAPHAGGADPS